MNMKLKKISIILLLTLAFLIIGNTKAYAGLSKSFDFNSDVLPSYYTKEWLSNVNSKVKQSSSKGVTTFAFITDIHFRHNSGYSAALLRNVNKNAKLDFVMNGGDTCSADATTGKTRTELLTLYDKLLDIETTQLKNYTNSLTNNGIKPYYVNGNHDFSINDMNNASNYRSLTVEKAYNLIMDTMKNNEISGAKGEVYYSFDDTDNKIRYIVLDVFENGPNSEAFVSKGQVNWFYQKLREVSDYKIVVFTHAPVNSKIASESSKNILFIQEIEEAYNNCKKSVIKIADKSSMTFDFRNNTNLIIAHYSGHTHRDRSSFDNNVLSITTTADYYVTKLDNYMWDRTKGTTSEQAFDIMTIDTNNNKIYANRVGAGNDREWNFPTKDLSKCKMSEITTTYYQDKGTTLNISILDGNKKLVKDVDYTETYKNNKAEGVATVTIKGKGTYKGTITKDFRIIKKANIDVNKEYYISSALVSGRVLGSSNQKGANATSQTLNCQDAQRFKFIKNSDGSYYIQNVQSKYCAEVSGGSTGTAKTKIIMNAKANKNAQKWFIGQNSNGTISFYTVDGLPIEVESDKNNVGVQINNYSNNNIQRFKLNNASEFSSINIDTSKNYYIVSSLDAKKAIDVYAGKTADFTNVDLYDLNKTVAQLFKFEKNSDGTYTIINKGSNKALDVYANKMADKTNVDIYTSNKSSAQKWCAIKNTDNSITFLGVESGKALDLYAAKTTNFTNIDIWDWNKTNAQKWNLLKQ